LGYIEDFSIIQKVFYYDKYMMKNKPSNEFFNDIDFVSIVNTIKGIMTSDGSMSMLLDFERVLDESDVYAFKNWILGELVQGPVIRRYTVKCVFMWPYKLMPDPRAAKRLLKLGCKITYGKSSLKVPVEVKDYDDFVPGTRYPKMKKREVWFVEIEIPKELMNDIKEGSIDLADQEIDLQELNDAYDNDLDQEGLTQDQGPEGPDMAAGGQAGMMPGMAPPPVV
jgi:hypothetical protein